MWGRAIGYNADLVPSVPMHRECRPRNIISADWHFAFATINIAPRPRNFEFYRDDFVRFPRCYELYTYICIYIYGLPDLRHEIYRIV